jgi:carboxymethylenebutenolidase
MMETIKAAFPRGTCPIHVFGTLGREGGNAPAVILYPDAFGPRPAADKLAETIAANGWRVLMYTPFYEFLPFDPIDPETAFTDPDKRAKFFEMFAHITPETISTDVDAMLHFVSQHFDPETPLAALGYCMGGRYALWSACKSEAVRFAGAFHAGKLAPEEGDGPHKHFADAKGRIYIGTAGVDQGYDAAEHGRLAAALYAAGTDHVIENYKDAGHGWVYEDLAVFDSIAADRHHRSIAGHFTDMLA